MAISLVYETHSTTLDNEAGVATGWLPGELSPAGRGGARELGARRRDDGLDRVVTSDLARAVERAAIAFAGSSIPVTRDARFRECSYGALNGAPVEALRPRTAYLESPFPRGRAIGTSSSRCPTSSPNLPESMTGSGCLSSATRQRAGRCRSSWLGSRCATSSRRRSDGSQVGSLLCRRGFGAHSSGETRPRVAFVWPRWCLAWSRRRWDPLVGVVARRGGGGGVAASRRSWTRRVRAATRFWRCERCSEATSTSWSPTRRSASSRRSRSLPAGERAPTAVDAAGRNTSSTRLSVVFTPWPPGPEARENRSTSSPAGMTIP